MLLQELTIGSMERKIRALEEELGIALDPADEIVLAAQVPSRQLAIEEVVYLILILTITLIL